MSITIRGNTLPGRMGEVCGLVASNARRSVQVASYGFPIKGRSEWGVRFGSRLYPDYAEPHPTAWDGQHHGKFLTPEQARALAAHLNRCADWAEAQNHLNNHQGVEE